jgi:hypothetical protein
MMASTIDFATASFKKVGFFFVVLLTAIYGTSGNYAISFSIIVIGIVISFTGFAGRLYTGTTTGRFLMFLALPALLFSAMNAFEAKPPTKLDEETAALRLTNPSKYLSATRYRLSRSEWLKEAKSLAPEIYDAEMKLEYDANLKLEQASQAATSKKKAKQELEDKKFARHCVSGWDGSVKNLKSTVVASLRNPDSFDHVKTLVGAMDREGYNQVAMEYRAQNGFGGLNVERIIVKMRNDDCAIVEVVM